MPAFTFEKIAPPVRMDAAPVAIRKPRGVLARMLDRLTESRMPPVAREAQVSGGFTEPDTAPRRIRRT